MKQNVRKLVFDNHNQEEIRSLAIENGMETLRDAALRKIFLGITTIQEMMRVTVQEY
jgi:type IV pilus assembly protein PilB